MAKKDFLTFDAFYGKVFGERWSCLRDSLSQEQIYAALYSRDAHVALAWEYPWMTLQHKEQESRDAYFLDPASAWAACQLPINPGDKVLDMCAAPGGKSLVLYNRMGSGCTLTSNELNMRRSERLSRVIERFKRDSHWQCARRDGSWYGLQQPGEYDAVLVDAPCSSERHWLQKDEWLANWRVSRTKRLAVTQWCLLASACDAVKVGGFVLYLTCALSEQENDGVIDKALKKRRVCVHHVDNPYEKTRHGFMILPDRADGWGPIYGCLIKRYAH